MSSTWITIWWVSGFFLWLSRKYQNFQLNTSWLKTEIYCRQAAFNLNRTLVTDDTPSMCSMKLLPLGISKSKQYQKMTFNDVMLDHRTIVSRFSWFGFTQHHCQQLLLPQQLMIHTFSMFFLTEAEISTNFFSPLQTGQGTEASMKQQFQFKNQWFNEEVRWTTDVSEELGSELPNIISFITEDG